MQRTQPWPQRRSKLSLGLYDLLHRTTHGCKHRLQTWVQKPRLKKTRHGDGEQPACPGGAKALLAAKRCPGQRLDQSREVAPGPGGGSAFQPAPATPATYGLAWGDAAAKFICDAAARQDGGWGAGSSTGNGGEGGRNISFHKLPREGRSALAFPLLSSLLLLGVLLGLCSPSCFSDF